MYLYYSFSTVARPTLDAPRRPGQAQPGLPDLLAPGKGPLRPAASSAEEKATGPAYVGDVPIPETLFSAKTYNALRRSRISTLKELCALEPADFKWLRSLGKKAEQEIAAYRARIGAPLKSNN
jgi:DNA-directed RNA polymerase alpha subunit